MARVHRRDLMKWAGAAALLPGCDRIAVDVVTKPGPADADGLFPITPTEYFYVYEQGEQPDPYANEDWSMEIRIQGTAVATLDFAYFATKQPIELEHTLQCIGGNPRNTLINNAVWGGLPFAEILADLGVDVPTDTLEVRMQGADLAGPSARYATSVPVDDLYDERLWLVWQLNGEELPFDHGAPCRFLVQGRYGTKNVKWPTSADLITEPFQGYWERLNWSNAAEYRVNGFILFPSDGTTVVPGVLIYGSAYAGDDPVSRVEITFDDGSTWQDADVYYSPGANRWTLWRHAYTGPSGKVHARIRATTASGEVTVGPEGSDQAFGYDGGMEVRFEVGQ